VDAVDYILLLLPPLQLHNLSLTRQSTSLTLLCTLLPPCPSLTQLTTQSPTPLVVFSSSLTVAFAYHTLPLLNPLAELHSCTLAHSSSHTHILSPSVSPTLTSTLSLTHVAPPPPLHYRSRIEDWTKVKTTIYPTAPLLFENLEIPSWDINQFHPTKRKKRKKSRHREPWLSSQHQPAFIAKASRPAHIGLPRNPIFLFPIRLFTSFKFPPSHLPPWELFLHVRSGNSGH
jgi:hypothetical protein